MAAVAAKKNAESNRGKSRPKVIFHPTFRPVMDDQKDSPTWLHWLAVIIALGGVLLTLVGAFFLAT